MRKILILIPTMIFSLIVSIAQTPLSNNGRLNLVGNQLSNECGNPVQLRGVSTHGVMFHQECYKESTVQSIAQDWGADVLRLAIYTEEEGGTPGYIKGDKEFWNSWIDQMVGYAKENGMYAVIDWHILHDGNPNTYINEAKTFFATMSEKYKNEKHVIYEICNEPNGAGWANIKSYANQVIPIIRANDPEGIIICGTPFYSSDLWAAANDPLTGANAYNVMYAFHFYANSHTDYNKLRQTAGEIPIFISEWGSVDASGNGGFNSGSSDNWLSIADGNNNGGITLSSCNWAFVDKNEAASVLNSGACEDNEWTNRTQAGNYIYNYMQAHPGHTQCNSAGDDDGDGVTNGDDLCSGTPPATFVDASGCPALQGDADFDGVIDANDVCPNTPSQTEVNINGCEIMNSFVSNVCEGFNNRQGYANQSFSEDTIANIDIWNRPENGSPVYSATVSNGTLNIDVTNADPDYQTQGFSFGEIYRFNGTDYDTTLTPIDLRGGATVKIDVRFEPNGYSLTKAMLDIALEDVHGNQINANPTGTLFRDKLDLNEWHNMTYEFTDGTRESYSDSVCLLYNKAQLPNGKCIIDSFDFSQVHKVLMWVNPDKPGEGWNMDESYNGIWRIDNFSIGLEGAPTNCDQTRDDDGDGVREEDDTCKYTAPGESVNMYGCSLSQLDNDMDGVSNLYDECTETPSGEEVDYKGCAGFEADDDEDGVFNDKDMCPETPQGAEIDMNGCKVAVAVSENYGDILNVFPIPTTNYLNIIQTEVKFSSASLTDISGKVVASLNLTGSDVIDLSAIDAGAYVLTLSGQDASESISVMVK